LGERHPNVAAAIAGGRTYG